LDPTFIVLQAQHPSALPLFSWDHVKWQSGLQIFKNWCPLYMTFTNVIWLGTGLIFALIFAHHTSNSCQNRWQHVERHDQIIFNPLIDRPHKCCPSKEMWMNKILSLLSCYSFLTQQAISMNHSYTGTMVQTTKVFGLLPNITNILKFFNIRTKMQQSYKQCGYNNFIQDEK
jgi:hypothetical protein